MMTFLKNGRNKVPLDRVPSLAKALEVDPAYLMRLALDQAVGATASKAITDIFGTPATENERGWLQELRDASDNSDPRITARSRAALRGIFGKERGRRNAELQTAHRTGSGTVGPPDAERARVDRVHPCDFERLRSPRDTGASASAAAVDRNHMRRGRGTVSRSPTAREGSRSWQHQRLPTARRST